MCFFRSSSYGRLVGLGLLAYCLCGGPKPEGNIFREGGDLSRGRIYVNSRYGNNTYKYDWHFIFFFF